MDVFSGTNPASGFEQLRHLLETGQRPPMLETLGIELEAVEAGRVSFIGHPTPEHYNPIGSVHGGYAATLLDSACGCAAHSVLTAEQSYTTLELKISFHRPIKADTGPVRVEGTLISSGRRAAFSEARLTDANGKLLASATSTLLVMTRG